MREIGRVGGKITPPVFHHFWKSITSRWPSSCRDPLQGTHRHMGMAFQVCDIGSMGLQALGALVLG